MNDRTGFQDLVRGLAALQVDARRWLQESDVWPNMRAAVSRIEKLHAMALRVQEQSGVSDNEPGVQ